MKIDFEKLLGGKADSKGLIAALHFPASVVFDVLEAISDESIVWASGDQPLSGGARIFADVDDKDWVELSFWKADNVRPVTHICYRIYSDPDSFCGPDSYPIEEVLLPNEPVECFDLTNVLDL